MFSPLSHLTRLTSSFPRTPRTNRATTLIGSLLSVGALIAFSLTASHAGYWEASVSFTGSSSSSATGFLYTMETGTEDPSYVLIMGSGSLSSLNHGPTTSSVKLYLAGANSSQNGSTSLSLLPDPTYSHATMSVTATWVPTSENDPAPETVYFGRTVEAYAHAEWRGTVSSQVSIRMGAPSGSSSTISTSAGLNQSLVEFDSVTDDHTNGDAIAVSGSSGVATITFPICSSITQTSSNVPNGTPWYSEVRSIFTVSVY